MKEGRLMAAGGTPWRRVTWLNWKQLTDVYFPLSGQEEAIRKGGNDFHPSANQVKKRWSSHFWMAALVWHLSNRRSFFYPELFPLPHFLTVIFFLLLLIFRDLLQTPLAALMASLNALWPCETAKKLLPSFHSAPRKNHPSGAAILI